MFNIKSIVNKITERGRDSQPNSPGRGNGEDILGKQAAEGFLCPRCMKAFPCPEDLQSHYVTSHDGDGDGAIRDVPAVTTALDFMSLHQEVGERYRRQEGNSTQATSVLDVQAITDPAELRQRLIEALENGAVLQQEKERLEQHAAHLAHSNVTLKAASDEEEGNQAALKERLKVLEAKLSHRESLDDAAVLRQELVQVQRVMDELTLEKEKELDELEAELKQLKDRYATREVTHDSNEEICNAETKRRLDELESVLRSRDNLVTELQRSVEAHKKELDEAETKLQQELSMSQTLEQELQVQKNKIIEVLEECQRKTDDFLHCQDEFVEVKRERDQLQKLQQNGANEINILIQQAEEMKVKYDTALKQLEEKQEAHKSAQLRFDALSKQKDILTSELIHKSKLCEEYEKSYMSLKEKNKEAEKRLSQKEEEILRLESERAELLVQIEAGEGANTAIQQISQEKVLLNNELKEQMNYHTTYAKEMSMKLDDATTRVHDLEKKNEDIALQLSNYENEIHTTRTELQASQKEVRRLTDELNKKESTLQALHSSVHHLKSEKDGCQLRIADLEGLLQEKSSLLADYSDKVKNMNDTLQGNETKLVELEGENKALEQKLTEHESKLVHLHMNLNVTELKLKDSDSKVEDLGAEIEMKTARAVLLEAENTRLGTEISLLKENLKENEEQLQVLGVQRASLETSLFEMEKDVVEEKKQIEDKWKKEVDSIKSLFEISQVKISEFEEGKKLLLDDKAKMMQQLATLEEHLEEVKTNACEKEAALQSQLSSVTFSKQTAEEELAVEKCELLKQQKDNKDMKETYEVEIEKKYQELKDVHSSLDEVAGEKLALEAQLAASQSERQALLERCCANTSETENLHKTITDLRRRLEESQAALHELGRENQTLQLELEKLLCRKWTEDSDVISCSLCQREFSLIVRKHHCRNCGQIFCNECSSKMAPIASNKKPVRVCDSCYNELGSK